MKERVAALPIQPFAGKTSGVKDALSFSDLLLISSALFLLVLAVDECHLLGLVGRGRALALKSLISKSEARCGGDQP